MTHTQTETYGFSADQFLQDKVNALPAKSFKVLAAVIPAMYDDESSVHLDYVTVEGMSKRGIVATLPRLSWFLYSENLRTARTGGTGYLLSLNTYQYGVYEYNVYEVNAAILVRLAAEKAAAEKAAAEKAAAEKAAAEKAAETQTYTLRVSGRMIAHSGRGELIANLARIPYGLEVTEYHSGDCSAPFDHLRCELFVLSGLVKKPSLLRAEVIETLSVYNVPAKQVRVLKHSSTQHSIKIIAPAAHSLLLNVPVQILVSVANVANADARYRKRAQEDTATEIPATEITATEITATEDTAPEITATKDTATEDTTEDTAEDTAPEIPAHDDAELLDQWRAANRAGEGCGFGDPDDYDCEEDIYEAAEREEEARVICALNVPDSYLVSWFDEYWVVCSANGWWACRVTL
jgi:hypothetical protein